MKTPLLLALLLGLIYYHSNSAAPTPGVEQTISEQPASHSVAAQAIIIVPAPSSSDRWKTGANAQTNLKTGPNAQTDLAPYAPSEQASWNQTPGYTIVAGANLRGH